MLIGHACSSEAVVHAVKKCKKGLLAAATKLTATSPDMNKQSGMTGADMNNCTRSESTSARISTCVESAVAISDAQQGRALSPLVKRGALQDADPSDSNRTA